MNDNNKISWRVFALIVGITLALIGLLYSNLKDSDASQTARTEKVENNINSINDKLSDMNAKLAAMVARQDEILKIVGVKSKNQ